ncbi:formimidoylglutamate deiminase [Conexibacter woesei]|uniref:formimidoylglutamate deiminase n=1 Tax=Conexibacter woesei TaxID=191495 RepID=UPI00054FE309|nr:formimidoylglutamate deiminase [Conexibacter woesei]
MSAQRYWCERAWVDGAVTDGVVLDVDGGVLARVAAGAREAGDEVLRGLTIPGLANAHSHAFQRALRGHTQTGTGSFWTWREQMYALATRLDPDQLHAIARAAFAEMALAGVTVVGEFHYVHHAPDGTPYADPNETGRAMIAAAAEAGIRITLLDTCYLHGGVDRFRDADVHGWAERVDGLKDDDNVRVGAAIHSIRAVEPDEAAVVGAWAAGRPLHAHVSEQPRENAECLERYGATPAALLPVAENFTAVHATHLTDEDVERLSVGTICLCPTTERDLADGVGPARRLAGAGARLSVGSDSHTVIDLFEEARAIELDERLVTGVRGHHRASELLDAATRGGYACLGWPDGGRLATGALADFVTVATDTIRTAGTPPEALVFSATAADVRELVVAGRRVVRDGRHTTIDVARELTEAIAR